jgi:hypothetical protein
VRSTTPAPLMIVDLQNPFVTRVPAHAQISTETLPRRAASAAEHAEQPASTSLRTAGGSLCSISALASIRRAAPARRCPRFPALIVSSHQQARSSFMAVRPEGMTRPGRSTTGARAHGSIARDMRVLVTGRRADRRRRCACGTCSAACQARPDHAS